MYWRPSGATVGLVSLTGPLGRGVGVRVGGAGTVAGPVPPNADLVFDIELVSIK